MIYFKNRIGKWTFVSLTEQLERHAHVFINSNFVNYIKINEVVTYPCYNDHGGDWGTIKSATWNIIKHNYYDI